MPINPSTDPAVYNTGSLKCIRAGWLAWEGRWFFFFPRPLRFRLRWSVIQGSCTVGNLHTYTWVFSPPHWSFYSLANTLRWNKLLLWCVQEHFPPLLTIYHLVCPSSHSSMPFVPDFSPPLWTPPPSLAVISPLSSLSFCQSNPPWLFLSLRPLLLSPPLPLVLPMLEVVDCRITLEPGEAVPLIVKRGTIGPLVWLGTQIDESV